MRSEAKYLLFIRGIENKSRFFSPTKNVGLQNDNHFLFSAACAALPLRVLTDFRSLAGAFALLGLALLAVGCGDLERNAYRVLAVSQAEYEAVQQHAAEAAVHGLISEEQWSRFQVAGHRFIAAHNAAVDAFALWSQAKTQGNAARLQAALEILPRLVAELNVLVESFERDAAVSRERRDITET